MFKKLGKGRLALAFAMVVVFCLGFAVPALAEEASYDPDKAMLTKVIDGAVDTDASADTYVFHFAGAGEVKAGDTEAGEDADKLYSDGVEQDTATLKVGDVVPTISDETLTGVKLTSEGTLTNGQVAQGVVQKSIADILTGVEFPHAGVYTYVVTEKSVNLSSANAGLGIYVNASKAEYVLRIRIANAYTEASSTLGDRTLTVESVTVEQTKDDNGDAITKQKINPTYPTTTMPDGSKIDKTAAGVSPTEGTLAGDSRGREVPGFTFANEYILGGSFQVKKLYDGDHSDRTKYSTVKLVVYSEAAKNPDARGACATYQIAGEGIDRTNNTDSYGEHIKLNGIEQGISQENDYMVEFNSEGYAVIVADLKEDSLIRVTGEFGPYNPDYAKDAPNGKDKRMTLSTSGLLVGQTYYVIEALPGDYDPTGYVYVGDDGTVDPRVSNSGMTVTQKLGTAGTDPAPESEQSATIPAGGLIVQDEATGNATTVFVVNKINENNVSPTGIFINNLPYILMVGVPLVVFAGMFVAKRRESANS
jgi:hypothetical protein